MIVGGGVVLAASYEAKACGVRTAMGGREARRLCPEAIVVPPRMAAYTQASKDLYAVFDDMSPLVEGLSIDEAFLDVRGMEPIAGTPVEIAVRLRRAVRERVGLPVSVGIARTKFLAKVASALAKPDGLLDVPSDGELEFLHPLPVERVWGVGRVTATSCAPAASTPSARSPVSTSPCWPSCSAGSGAPSARAREQRRSPARAAAPPSPLDRLAASARAEAQSSRGARRGSRRARRSRHSAVAGIETCRPDRRAAAALRGLLPRNAFAHAPAPDRADAGRPRRRPQPVRRGAAAIDRRGLTLIGIAIANLEADLPRQLSLPLGAEDGAVLDGALDEIRDRFGSTAITRAVLLGRPAGLTMPLLPGDDAPGEQRALMHDIVAR